MSEKISPILRDWLTADNVTISPFVREARTLVAQGIAARWTAKEGSSEYRNARAVWATFGLGVVASWEEPEGTFHLEHVETRARLIIPYRMVPSLEHSIIGSSFSTIASLPFRLSQPYNIVDVHKMQAGLGLSILFEAEPVMVAAREANDSDG